MNRKSKNKRRLLPRKWLALMLCVCIATTMFPQAAMAEDGSSKDDPHVITGKAIRHSDVIRIAGGEHYVVLDGVYMTQQYKDDSRIGGRYPRTGK